MNDTLAEKFVLQLAELDPITSEAFLRLQRKFCKENQTSFLQKDKLVSAYQKLVQANILAKNEAIENILKLKNTRSLSGIVVVSVLTKPYPCPNNCLYCPTQANTPKSYLTKEPAVARAIMCDYNPYRQTIARLKALKSVGHPIEKVNIRIIGGTWSYYSKSYQTRFIKELFRACNEFSRHLGPDHGSMTENIVVDSRLRGNDEGGRGNDGGKRGNNKEECEKNKSSYNGLFDLQKINEAAKSRIVEISIETRPDFIDLNELKRLRTLGITKVELGVQSIYDDVLELNNRGHAVEATAKATQLLKDYGFKVSYQMMANLPGSNLKKDLIMFKKLFSDERFCPDHLKIYPLALVKEAAIYELYQKKQYKPYSKEELIELLAKIKREIPPYCRVERVIRDIPADYIVEGGAKVSNLRQQVLKRLEDQNARCQCIRCREIKSEKLTGKEKLIIREYQASDGRELFLSFETSNKLISMLRLRLPNDNKRIFSSLNDAALIREIHTYGQQVGIGQSDKNAAQHKGFGKKLIRKAEEIAKENGYNKIAVIAGVGVRGYFNKLGYYLKDTYMLKSLDRDQKLRSEKEIQ